MILDRIEPPSTRVSAISCPHCGHPIKSIVVHGNPEMLNCDAGSCGKYFVIVVESVLNARVAKVGEFV